MDGNANAKPRGGANDHLANERTFLAWVRTSIGIMGFGFVVVKFSLFMRQLAAVLEAPQALPPGSGFSQVVGITLVALGGLIILLAYFRYWRTKKQLESGNFIYSDWLVRISAALLFLCSVLLFIYLFKNIR